MAVGFEGDLLFSRFRICPLSIELEKFLVVPLKRYYNSKFSFMSTIKYQVSLFVFVCCGIFGCKFAMLSRVRNSRTLHHNMVQTLKL